MFKSGRKAGDSSFKYQKLRDEEEEERKQEEKRQIEWNRVSVNDTQFLNDACSKNSDSSSKKKSKNK